MYRVGLLTNEPILSEGFRTLLSREEALCLGCVFSSLAEVRTGWRTSGIDLLVVDLGPDLDLTSLLNLVQSQTDLKVVLWAHSVSLDIAAKAIAAGVRGILKRTLSFELQSKCMEQVAEGDVWFEKDLLLKMLKMKKLRLSKREAQLVSLVSRGAKNKEIAEELLLTEGTVKTYLSKLFRKLGVKDRYELALYGLTHLTMNQAGDVLLLETERRELGALQRPFERLDAGEEYAYPGKDRLH